MTSLCAGILLLDINIHLCLEYKEYEDSLCYIVSL